MELADLQDRVDARFGQGDRERGAAYLTTVLVEEVGELATAARRDDLAALGDEAVDVAFLALCLANLADVDVGERLEATYLDRSPGEVADGWEDAASP